MSKNKNNLYECVLCTENMIDNDRIICPHCSVELCESCFQYSITMEIQDPVCVYCKKPLSIEFILSNNSNKWCEKIFLDYYSTLLLEKEKNKLVNSIPKFKIHVEINKLKKEKNQLSTNKAIEKEIINYVKLKDEISLKDIKKSDLFLKLYNNKIDERNAIRNSKNTKIEELEKSLNINKKVKKEKVIYISKCPNEKCKGYINNKYQCELCDILICKACFMIKKEDHICKTADIESAELIKKDTKSCPGCYTNIFKINGCNQMFCTNCNIVFHWETLEIDKGPVHNQHYFDYITKLSNSSEQIRIENAACGHIRELYPRIMKYIRRCWIHNLYLINQEIEGEIIIYFRERFKNNFEDYRIQYLFNKLSEEKWKNKIMKDTIFNEANKSYIEILEMFITISSDMIRKLCFEIDDILIQKEKEAKQIIISIFKKNIYTNSKKENVIDFLDNEQCACLSQELLVKCENKYIFLNEETRYMLINFHNRNQIDWENIDLSKHNVLDEINIYVTNLGKLVKFKDYTQNFGSFKNHFKKCLDETYQTFGIRINNKHFERTLNNIDNIFNSRTY